MYRTDVVVRRRLLVSGRVQGVWFRGACAQQARALGLNGWARNLPDGRLEVVLEGQPDDVQRLEEWCHIGPPSAAVVDVEGHDETVQGLTSFATH